MTLKKLAAGTESSCSYLWKEGEEVVFKVYLMRVEPLKQRRRSLEWLRREMWLIREVENSCSCIISTMTN